MKTKPIFRRAPNLLPSMENIHGWLSQYERLLRWHERLATEGSLDFYLSFFLNCYALRDWLMENKVISSKDLDVLIGRSRALSLCRDICNRSKHLVLTHRPSVDQNFSIMMEYRGKTKPPALVILAGGTKTDLSELAAACLSFWLETLTTKGLLD